MKQETLDLLQEQGWRESRNMSKNYARCFYKRFETEHRCFGNSNKEGIQVQLAVTEYRKMDGMHESYELEITGGLEDHTWVQLLNYALPGDINRVLALIPRLVKIWEACNE